MGNLLEILSRSEYYLKTDSLDNAVPEFWLVKRPWYMSHCTMPNKYGKSMRQGEKKSSLNQQDWASFRGWF